MQQGHSLVESASIARAKMAKDAADAAAAEAARGISGDAGIRAHDLYAAQVAAAAKAEQEAGQLKIENARKGRELALKEADTVSQIKKRKDDTSLGWAANARAKEGLRIQADEARQRGDEKLAAQIDKNAERASNILVQPDGSPFLARSKEDAQKADDIATNYRAFKANMRRIRELRQDIGSEVVTGATDKGREMRSLHTGLKILLKNSDQLGQLTGGDTKLIDDQLGEDPGSFVDPTSKWNALEQRLDRSFDTYMSTRGFKGSASRQLDTVDNPQFQAGGLAKSAPVPQETGKEADDRIFREIYGRDREPPAEPKLTPEEEAAKYNRYAKEIGLR
jgi:hypothetical protein